MAISSLLDNPTHWRDRANHTRTVAESMFDEESKYRLLKVAWEYERLADCAEQRLAQHQLAKSRDVKIAAQT
jgi:hypothetical protein